MRYSALHRSSVRSVRPRYILNPERRLLLHQFFFLFNNIAETKGSQFNHHSAKRNSEGQRNRRSAVRAIFRFNNYPFNKRTRRTSMTNSITSATRANPSIKSHSMKAPSTTLPFHRSRNLDAVTPSPPERLPCRDNVTDIS